MASTITSATLSVVRTESVTLNGKVYGNTNTSTFTSINEVDQRIVTVPTSEITLILFDTAAAAGQYVRANLKYLRILNKDDTNFVSIKIADGGTDHAWLKVPAGGCLELDAALIEVAGSFSAWANVETISAIADTAAVDVEYFIALT